MCMGLCVYVCICSAAPNFRTEYRGKKLCMYVCMHAFCHKLCMCLCIVCMHISMYVCMGTIHLSHLRCFICMYACILPCTMYVSMHSMHVCMYGHNSPLLFTLLYMYVWNGLPPRIRNIQVHRHTHTSTYTHKSTHIHAYINTRTHTQAISPRAATAPATNATTHTFKNGLPPRLRNVQVHTSADYMEIWHKEKMKSESKPSFLGRGLNNPLGNNNCFLNVIIQSLAQLKDFRNPFIDMVILLFYVFMCVCVYICIYMYI